MWNACKFVFWLVNTLSLAEEAWGGAELKFLSMLLLKVVQKFCYQKH